MRSRAQSPSTPAEGRGGSALGPAALASLCVVALVEQARHGRGPLPEEVLGPLAIAWPAWPLARAGLTLGAGLGVAALLVAAGRRRARAGAFGSAAASAVAAALASLVLGQVDVQVSLAACLLTPAAAALTGMLLAPLLRDRGLLALALISVGVGLAVTAARRAALEERAAAAAFARLRDAVLQVGARHVLASVAPDTPLPWRWALARSLRPPFHAETIDLLAVEHGDIEQELLQQAGWPGVRCEGERVSRLEAAPPAPPAPFPYELAVRPHDERGPLVVAHPAEGRFTLRVVTAAGVVRQEVEGSERGLVLQGEARARFFALTEGVPWSPWVVRVERAELVAGSAWLEGRGSG